MAFDDILPAVQDGRDIAVVAEDIAGKDAGNTLNTASLELEGATAQSFAVQCDIPSKRTTADCAP